MPSGGESEGGGLACSGEGWGEGLPRSPGTSPARLHHRPPVAVLPGLRTGAETTLPLPSVAPPFPVNPGGGGASGVASPDAGSASAYTVLVAGALVVLAQMANPTGHVGSHSVGGDDTTGGKRARVTSKGSDVGCVNYQTGTALLLPRLLADVAAARCSSPAAADQDHGWTLQPAAALCADPRRRHQHPPMLLARSRHASMRSLERYARPGPEALARHAAATDLARRRQR